MGDAIAPELAYAVGFALGEAYERNSMWPEALSTYSLIVKNKAFAGAARLRCNMGERARAACAAYLAPLVSAPPSLTRRPTAPHATLCRAARCAAPRRPARRQRALRAGAVPAGRQAVAHGA